MISLTAFMGNHTQESGSEHIFSNINGQVVSFLLNKRLLSKRQDSDCVEQNEGRGWCFLVSVVLYIATFRMTLSRWEHFYSYTGWLYMSHSWKEQPISCDSLNDNFCGWWLGLTQGKQEKNAGEKLFTQNVKFSYLKFSLPGTVWKNSSCS